MRFLLPLLFGFLLAPPLLADDPDPVTTEELAGRCTEAVHNEFRREQRRWRIQLFGRKSAASMSQGSRKEAPNGTVFLKHDDDCWGDPTAGDFTCLLDDEDFDTLDANAWGITLPYTGLFEITSVQTSEILPDALLSARTFQCRLRSVCAAAKIAGERESTFPEDITVTSIPGCSAERQTIPVCRSNGAPGAQDAFTFSLLEDECSTTAFEVFEQEMALLRLAVSYDAAYRSLLQFAGTFDQGKQGLSSNMLEPIRQAVSVLGHLHRIPCFLSACNMVDSSGSE